MVILNMASDFYVMLKVDFFRVSNYDLIRVQVHETCIIGNPV